MEAAICVMVRPMLMDAVAAVGFFVQHAIAIKEHRPLGGRWTTGRGGHATAG